MKPLFNEARRQGLKLRIEGDSLSLYKNNLIDSPDTITSYFTWPFPHRNGLAPPAATPPGIDLSWHTNGALIAFPESYPTDLSMQIMSDNDIVSVEPYGGWWLLFEPGCPPLELAPKDVGSVHLHSMEYASSYISPDPPLSSTVAQSSEASAQHSTTSIISTSAQNTNVTIDTAMNLATEGVGSGKC